MTLMINKTEFDTSTSIGVNPKHRLPSLHGNFSIPKSFLNQPACPLTHYAPLIFDNDDEFSTAINGAFLINVTDAYTEYLYLLLKLIHVKSFQEK